MPVRLGGVNGGRNDWRLAVRISRSFTASDQHSRPRGLSHGVSSEAAAYRSRSLGTKGRDSSRVSRYFGEGGWPVWGLEPAGAGDGAETWECPGSTTGEAFSGRGFLRTAAGPAVGGDAARNPKDGGRLEVEC